MSESISLRNSIESIKGASFQDAEYINNEIADMAESMHKRVDIFKDSLTEYVASMYNINEYLIEEANYHSILLEKMKSECATLQNFFMDCAKFAESFPKEMSSNSVTNKKDEPAKLNVSTKSNYVVEENEFSRSNLENTAVPLNSTSDEIDSSRAPLKKQKTSFRGLQNIN